MSCLDIQEAPGRQAVCVQQPGGSPLQRLETLSARQQEEQESIMEVSLQKTGKILPFFLFYEEEKQGVTKKKGSREREAASPVVYRRAVFVLY